MDPRPDANARPRRFQPTDEAFATRTTHASLMSIGPFSNRLLLWGIAFELVFAAAVVYLPPLQDIFHTAALGPGELLLLAAFPPLVWASDELRRAVARRAVRRRQSPVEELS